MRPRRNRRYVQTDTCDTHELLRALHSDLVDVKLALEEIASLLKGLLSERELL